MLMRSLLSSIRHDLNLVVAFHQRINISKGNAMGNSNSLRAAIFTFVGQSTDEVCTRVKGRNHLPYKIPSANTADPGNSHALWLASSRCGDAQYVSMSLNEKEEQGKV
jgi:hypothetical protein